MIVDLQLGLLAVFAALLAVLVGQIVELRGGMRDLRQNLLDVKSRISEAEYLARALPQAGGEQNGALPHPAGTVDAPAQRAVEPDRTAGEQSFSAEVPARVLREESRKRPAHGHDKARSRGSFQDTVQELYRRWCVEGHRPVPPDRIQIGLLRYTGDRRGSEMSPAVHVFSDDPQTGEFVRFWAVETDKGLAFPNPEAFFSEAVHPILFPALNAGHFVNPRNLADTPPVRILRQPGGTWQKAP